MPTLRVLGLAGSALLQDAGRPGHRLSGVPRSGAFDRQAYGAAVALVGGGEGEAAIELLGELTVRCSALTTCAFVGGSRARQDGRPAPLDMAFDVPAGGSLVVGTERRGYLAVAGGIQGVEVLGSRSTCLLSALGPAPLRVGQELPLAERCWTPTAGDFCRLPTADRPIGVVPGPHPGFEAGVVEVLDGSRIGVRVRPAAMTGGSATLASFGVLPGSIQALPSGDWMVLGPDAGTMGGYPVIGVVSSADQDRWARAMAGDRVALAAVPADHAPDPVEPRVVRVSYLRG